MTRTLSRGSATGAPGAVADIAIRIELLAVSLGVDLRGLPHALAIADAMQPLRIKVLA